MLKYRFSIVVALLIIAITAAWYFYYKLQSQPAVDDTLREQFSWQLSPAAEGHTAVSLKIANVSVAIGTYAGTCDNPLTLLPGELTGVVCKDESGGREIGVFRENGKLLIEDGSLDPQTGRGVDFAPVTKQQ